ncbi:S1C family serine protease [Microvirga guangxiensis]|uniref:Trypsin-like peptidase domain-containing protein n=1 Tax=Microvirga guangxiensis TaxID=549386 RepID=A0A1G5L1F9_9HYPH|nr:serine protease [Microvirga guangxiensis]SCZ06271.1 Trypsin-like peptidase domain-containing protein [Microvirga guangxiensis]
MRFVFIAASVAICALSSSALAGSFTLSGDARWVALASRQSLDEAIGVAHAYRWRFPTVRVMQATNGWYAIVAGPERIPNPRAYKEALVRTGEIPGDTIITRGQGYVAEVWKPSTFKPLIQAKYDGAKQVNLRSGELVLNVSSLANGTESGRFPVLSGAVNGRVAFTARLEESSNEVPNAEVSVVRLDPSSVEPQVVFSSFWGGAHCCTVTKIATKVGNEWRVVQGKTIDGDGGYTFDDIDGDGAAELLSIDQSFLYTFAPYAGSWAPESISKLSGDRLIDVTAHPAFRPYMRQELYRIEYLASREPSLWRSNGFLAAWVATKAIVGEFDDGWNRMLPLYDRGTDWPLTECTVARVGGSCPDGKERTIEFPVALRKHLEEEGYIPRIAPASQPESVAVARPTPVAPNAAPKEEKRTSSGTGFFVTREGHVVTNNHVIEGCTSVQIKPSNGSPLSARILAQDTTNDLALLKAERSSDKFATVRAGVRLGEAVAAFGFPLNSVLASSGNFTLGNVTALAGIGDDSRFLQISTPVQPGNSGGPLLDESGNVVGVVTSKLNALKTVVAIGDVPQNVNFAIKAGALATFLESARVEVPAASHASRLSPPDLADIASGISVLVRCD